MLFGLVSRQGRQQRGSGPSSTVWDRKAKVAVARKLAVILHRMWVDGTEFVWSSKTAVASTVKGELSFPPVSGKQCPCRDICTLATSHGVRAPWSEITTVADVIRRLAGHIESHPQWR